MGFAIYRQSKDWSAKDFDTGGDRPFASLANVPRQILEGLQLKKENELKEREQLRKESDSASEQKSRSDAAERDKQRIALQEQGMTQDQSNADRSYYQAKERAAMQDVVQQQMFVEQQKNNKVENEQRMALTKKILSELGGSNRDLGLQRVNTTGGIQKRDMISHVYNMGEEMFNPDNEAGAKAIANLAKNKQFMKQDEYTDSFHQIYQYNLDHFPDSIKIGPATLDYEKQKRLINATFQVMDSLRTGKVDSNIQTPLIYNGGKMIVLGKSQTKKNIPETEKKGTPKKDQKKETIKNESLMDTWFRFVVSPSLWDQTE